jgi:hypothetical protein
MLGYLVFSNKFKNDWNRLEDNPLTLSAADRYC